MPDGRFSREGLRIDPATVDGWLGAARSARPARASAPRAPLFIKGPLPAAWFRAAAALPGKALAVGQALWFLRGLKGRRTVRLAAKALACFAVRRKPGQRGLAKLEAAGLVRVERKRGRSPLVTILEAPGDGAGGAGG